jgi:hypothetical protein
MAWDCHTGPPGVPPRATSGGRTPLMNPGPAWAAAPPGVPGWRSAVGATAGGETVPGDPYGL